jgi:malate dehydrogenase (oxaloacetate-decarboxylating)(NADP+)
MQMIIDRVRADPKRMVFAEGEEEKTIRAAMAWRNLGLGTPILIGREERIAETLAGMGLKLPEGLEIHNARLSERNATYTEFLYGRGQRQGMLFRDCQRQVNLDRNVFGSCMVAHGDADAMVTGLTRNYTSVLRDVRKVIDPRPGERLFGSTMMVARGRTVFIADSTVHELPTPVQLADIATQAAHSAQRMGFTPRVAFLSFSTFGNRRVERAMRTEDAVAELDRREVDFEYDGEMSADVALDPELMALYPFCRLSGPANVLIMPALHSAHISSKLLRHLGGGTVIGPLLIGLSKPVQILPMNASVSEIINLAAIAAYDAIGGSGEVVAQAAE